MALIIVHFQDGTEEKFDDSISSSGTKNKISTEDGLLIVTDSYGKQTMYPLTTIKKVDHFTEYHRSF